MKPKHHNIIYGELDNLSSIALLPFLHNEPSVRLASLAT